jgi:type II secretory ATPase GspE/PulE/Tfp pilus assembly ATPase PilB-like protein
VEAAALPVDAASERPLLGELLVEAGQLSRDQLDAALAQQQQFGRRLGEILVGRGWISSRALAEALARQHGLEFVDLARAQVDPVASGLLQPRFARRHQALPVRFVSEDEVVVAVADPTNVQIIDDLRLAIPHRITLAVAESDVLDGALARIYRVHIEIREGDPDDELEPEEDDTSLQDVMLDRGAATAPTIDLVNTVLARAIEEDASDIHFDPERSGLVVRARIDGVLRRMGDVPRSMQTAVIGRLKIMGRLDIAERRLPQDGSFAVLVGGEPLDVRIAAIPTKHGEHIVLRLLHRRGVQMTLPELGMSPAAHEVFLRSISQPDGAVITCGPTGSGKTTTLYAALDSLNDDGRAIATIEDPVEYQIAGIQQVQAFPKIGLTFASGLRTLLRADPDVLLIGEMRDEETARIAIQASLTGHLVLTTLHTKNAPSSVARLRDMGIEPGLLATSINCIVAQRLARRLCLVCREAYEPDGGEAAAFGIEHADGSLHRARGCVQCGGTGYRGRVALYELMPIEGRVRAAIEGTTDEIFEAAVAQGMTTLRDEGIRLAVAGITSLEEVRRVAGDAR